MKSEALEYCNHISNQFKVGITQRSEKIKAGTCLSNLPENKYLVGKSIFLIC
jgi:hypothetical protein